MSFFVSQPIFAETTVNSGFIPGQIWYSKDPLIEGETVNIHTAAWNGESNTVSADVEFYDKNVILGSRDVVLDSLELKDVYIPWKITSGDHVISAKIISSTITVSDKKENVIVKHSVTSSDKQFVSVVVKNKDGEPVTDTDILKNQLDKANSQLSGILPEEVNSSLSNSISSLDNIRHTTLDKVNTAKEATQKEIGKVLGVSTKISQSPSKSSNVQDSIKRPVAYIKLFLLSTLSFILGSKLIFYGILVFLIFCIIRFIYRKIRNR